MFSHVGSSLEALIISKSFFGHGAVSAGEAYVFPTLNPTESKCHALG